MLEENTIHICSYDQKLLPYNTTIGSVGYDVFLAEDIYIKPQQIILAKLGIKAVLPKNWYCQIYARSSLPIKHGLILANGVGIVDNDYRGEYMIQLMNVSQGDIHKSKYDNLAQLIFQPYFPLSGKEQTIAVPHLVHSVDATMFDTFDTVFPTHRGSGGFGSTDKS